MVVVEHAFPSHLRKCNTQALASSFCFGAKDSNLSKSANFKAVAMQIQYMKNLKTISFQQRPLLGLLKRVLLKVSETIPKEDVVVGLVGNR